MRIRKKIANYEQKNYACKIKGKMHFKTMPFYAKDSLKILRNQYLITKQQHLNMLNKNLDSLQHKIELKTEEAKSIKNETLKKYFLKKLEQMKTREIQLLENIRIYKENPERTKLKIIRDKQHFYSLDSNAVIAFQIDAEFNASQGQLEAHKFKKSYLLSIDKKTILGELN